MNIKDTEANSAIIRSANIVLESSTKSVFIDAEPVDIKGLNYLFLRALLLSEQKLVSYQELAQLVWGKPEVSYEVMAQRASLVRKAIGDKEKQRFESIRGQGYQWLSPIEFGPQQPSSSEDKAGSKTAKILALLAAFLLPLVIYLSLTTAEVTETSSAKSDVTSPAKPLLLERAEYFAAQHTSSGNRIALDLYRSAIDTSDPSPELLFTYSALLIERVAKFEREPNLLQKAMGSISELKQLNTDGLAINWLQGYYFDVLGDIDSAIAFYQKSLTVKEQPLSRTAGSLAYLYSQKGKLFEAMSLNVSSLQGRGFYRLLQIAEILYLTDLEPQAQQWIQSAYKLAPNDGFSSLQYAKYLYVKGNRDKALEVLERFHSLTDKTSASLTCLALLHFHLGDLALAKTLLTEALDIEPNAMRPQAMLAWLNNKSAAAESKLAVPLLPENTSWPQDYIDVSIFHLSQFDKKSAINSLYQAYELGFTDYKYLQALPFFEELQQETRFVELLENMRNSANAERAKIQLTELPDLTLLLQAK